MTSKPNPWRADARCGAAAAAPAHQIPDASATAHSHGPRILDDSKDRSGTGRVAQERMAMTPGLSPRRPRTDPHHAIAPRGTPYLPASKTPVFDPRSPATSGN